MASETVPIERLLEHHEWVRDLARRLAGAPADASDLEQQVWMTALRAPPVDAHGLRGWLATVARNTLSKERRGARRRAHHESSARAHTQAPSVADTVARADAHQRVVAAVMALPDVQRDAVLLRFFDRLSVADVAERTGAPPATVRTRLRRALATLRGSLEREYGDRRSWLGALVLLGGPPAPDGPGGSGVATAGVGMGAMTMAGTTKTAILAAGAIAVAGGALWFIAGSGGADPAASGPASSEAIGDVGDSEVPAGSRAHARVEAPVLDEGPLPDATGPETVVAATVMVTVIDGDDRPVADARIVTVTGTDVPQEAPRTGSDGTSRLPASDDDRFVVAIADGHPPTASPLSARQTTIELVVAAGRDVHGLMRVDGAAPATSLRLALYTAATGPKWPDGARERLDEKGIRRGESTTTPDDTGRFVFRGLPEKTAFWLELPPGHVTRATRDESVEVAADAVRLDLDLIRTPLVTGRVVDAEGAPVPHAGVFVEWNDPEGMGGGTGTEADADGTFAIALSAVGPHTVTVQVAHPEGAGSRTLAIPESRTMDHALGDIALTAARDLVLRVVDAAGEPVARAVAFFDGDDVSVASSPPTGDAGTTSFPIPRDAVAVRVAALGYDVREVALGPDHGEPVTVELIAGTLLTADVPGLLAPERWRVRLVCPGDATDPASLDAYSVLGASSFGASSFGREGVRALLRLRDERLVLAGLRARTEFSLALVDPLGLIHAELTTELAAGERRTVTLRPRGEPRTISGQVMGADGEPVARARVVVAAATTDLARTRSAERGLALRTGDDGRFTLSDIRVDRVHVLVLADGYVPISRGDVDLSDDRHIDVALQSGRTARVHVTDGEGSTVTDVAVSVTAPEGSFDAGRPLWTARLRGDRFEIGGLPTGPVTFVARRDGRTWTAISGADDVDLVLTAE